MANSNLVTREDLKNVFEALGEGDYGARIDALEERIDVLGDWFLPSTGYSILNFTTGTANTWQKCGNLVIPFTGIWRVRAPYVNSAVYGVAFSSTSASSISTATILAENATAATVDVLYLFGEGTYAFWEKPLTASRANYIEIYPVLRMR